MNVLTAEVPLHYLVDVGADRLHEMVNRGVRAGRDWCAERKIPLADPMPAPGTVDPVSRRFTEHMAGAVDGLLPGTTSALSVAVTITVEDIDRFVTDPGHTASVNGSVRCAEFGGERPLTGGAFELLVDDGDPSRKEMRYRLHFTDAMGEPLTLLGVKHVDSGNPLRVWTKTTTLHTRLVRGHPAAGEQTHTAEPMAHGVLRLGLPDFLRELTTIRLAGSTPAARAAGLTRFGTVLLGKLWDVYARPVLSWGPV